MNHSKKALNFRTISIFLLLLFVSASTSLLGQDAASLGFVDGQNYDQDVIYKTVGNTNLKLDIFYPDSAKLKKNNPWMIFVHGGGWAGGNRTNIFKSAFIGTLENIVDSGIVCVNVQYRLAKSPVTSYESSVDVKDAIKFLVKNADQYKLDDEEYGTWGGSAGGHLCLVAALGADSSFVGDAALSDISTNAKCVASFYPFTSCLNPDLRPSSIFADETLFVRLLGGTLAEKPDMARLLSPALDLTANSPSILLLHGDKDPTLPIINSTYMMEVAAEVNADVQLLTVNGAGHSFSGNNISPSFDEIADSCSNYILSHINRFKEYTLASIVINNTSLKPFNPQVYEYNIALDAGTTTIPTITGIPNDTNATVTVIPATALTGTTTILVTAQDSSTRTYTFKFTYSSSLETELEAKFEIYPNPASDIITVNSATAINSITLFNTAGMAIKNISNIGLSKAIIDIRSVKMGFYFLTVESTQGFHSQRILIN